MKPQLGEVVLGAMLGAVDEGIHAVDIHGCTIFYNAAAARIDGLGQEEVVDCHVLDVFPSLTPGTSTLLQVIRTGEPVTDQQQSFTNFKGRRVTTINTTLPLWVEGELVGALEISKDITRLEGMVERITSLQALVSSSPRGTRASSLARYTLNDLVGNTDSIRAVKERVQRICTTSSPVLIVGQTGTGKELVAQSLHSEGPRARAPFIAQNCAAVPETLLESTLMGTVRGAFTGARDAPGLFELADGGTLYLDELDSMPLNMQAKLLRVVEEGFISRLGEAKQRPVAVRLVASLGDEAQIMVEAGKLRQDLYYRLNVVTVTLPPLRQRRDDIPLLIDHFMHQHARRLQRSPLVVSAEVLAACLAYDWPGNVRELEHLVEGWLHLVEGKVECQHLPTWGRRQSSSECGRSDLRTVLAATERNLIENALAMHDHNVSQAAAYLGVPRQTLQYRLRVLRTKRREVGAQRPKTGG